MTDTQQVFSELIQRYNEKQAEWIECHGTDEGFDAWFTEQVLPKKNRPPATLEEIQAARELYGTSDIEIDEDAVTSPNEVEGVGRWVSAWVFVHDEDLELLKDSETAQP